MTEKPFAPPEITDALDAITDHNNRALLADWIKQQHEYITLQTHVMRTVYNEINEALYATRNVQRRKTLEAAMRRIERQLPDAAEIPVTTPESWQDLMSTMVRQGLMKPSGDKFKLTKAGEKYAEKLMRQDPQMREVFRRLNARFGKDPDEGLPEYEPQA